MVRVRLCSTLDYVAASRHLNPSPLARTCQASGPGGVAMFTYEPSPTQYLDASGIKPKVRDAVGDIRQPWVDLGLECGISAFAAKALFALGMMRRYIQSANVILRDLRHLGFLSACGLLGSGVEILGRCIHQDRTVRQDPVSRSLDRLQAGFEFVRRCHLPSGIRLCQYR